MYPSVTGFSKKLAEKDAGHIAQDLITEWHHRHRATPQKKEKYLRAGPDCART